MFKINSRNKKIIPKSVVDSTIFTEEFVIKNLVIKESGSRVEYDSVFRIKIDRCSRAGLNWMEQLLCE